MPDSLGSHAYICRRSMDQPFRLLPPVQACLRTVGCLVVSVLRNSYRFAIASYVVGCFVCYEIRGSRITCQGAGKPADMTTLHFWLHTVDHNIRQMQNRQTPLDALFTPPSS